MTVLKRILWAQEDPNDGRQTPRALTEHGLAR